MSGWSVEGAEWQDSDEPDMPKLIETTREFEVNGRLVSRSHWLHEIHRCRFPFGSALHRIARGASR